MTSKIEWTEDTWNPVVGCSIVSPGCTNCYAMKLAPKLAANPASPQYAGTVQNSKGGPVWTGKVNAAPDGVWEKPLRRRKPTMYFVNSMGDLFHESVPDEWIDRAFAIMALCPQHTFQVLTKRADRMKKYFAEGHRSSLIEGYAQMIYDERHNADSSLWLAVNLPLLNVWLGVSAEDQTRADERIPDLLNTPAAIRFVSAEPLLGQIWLNDVEYDGVARINALAGTHGLNAHGSGKSAALDWVIVGGESGNGARPMHPDWARSLQDQCAEANVPFFFKQWGNWRAHIDRDKDDPDWRQDYSKFKNDRAYRVCNLEGGHGFHGERVMIMERVKKDVAGRLLDGAEHSATPSGFVSGGVV